MKLPDTRYRPEIDGLRAIAILVVVLFHTKLGFKGGYVGVDVFFVISGYLITSLILRDLALQQFTMITFWERRIRRIFPALAALLLCTMVAGWFIYFPADYGRLGASVVAQSLFAANIFTWKNTGYFTTTAETMPLLHMWSLAVEEQFYILLPPLMVALHRFQQPFMTRTLLFLFLASFSLCLWTTPIYPNSAFFLLPMRAWEMLLGSLLSIYPHCPLRSRWKRELLGVVGIAFVLLACVTFDSTTVFPGLSASLPCCGAALFIWATSSGPTSVGQLFSQRPVVFIGQISYSLYLVHWPLLVFSEYFAGDTLSLQLRCFLLVLMFLIATISWLIVETPVRKKMLFAQRRTLFVFSAIFTLIQLGGGLMVYSNRGIPTRFEPIVSTLNSPTIDKLANKTQTSLLDAQTGRFRTIGLESGELKCFLWGDSHAMALARAIEIICKKSNCRALQATHSSTPPILDFIQTSTYSLGDDSPAYNAAIVDYLIANKIPLVIMAAFWSESASNSMFEVCINKTLERLTRENINVVLVCDVPNQMKNVPYVLARTAMLNQPIDKVGIPIESHRFMNRVVDAVFAKLTDPRITVIDPAILLTDQSGLCRAEFGGKALYYDGQHLSCEGSERLIPLLEPLLVTKTEEKP